MKKLWESPKFLFKAKKPEDLNKFIGRTVLIPEIVPLDGKPTKIGEDRVTIETICPNMGMTFRGSAAPKPQYYEINGKHLISMLRFHAQMTGARDITEEQFLAFEDMDFSAEKLPQEPNAETQTN